jgi:hypothetical protein
MQNKDLFNKIEPIVAICLLITLILLGILLYKDNILKEEIAKSCGYELGEDYVCYCEKGFILNKKIELNLSNNEESIINVTLDR